MCKLCFVLKNGILLHLICVWIMVRTGSSELGSYQTGSMTAEHLLQPCPATQQPKAPGLAGGEAPAARKLSGHLDNLQCMAVFMHRALVSTWETGKKNETTAHSMHLIMQFHAPGKALKTLQQHLNWAYVIMWRHTLEGGAVTDVITTWKAWACC